MAVYNLRYQPDSTNPATRTVLMALLIKNNTSVFGAWGNINVDTAKYLDKSRGGSKWLFKLQPPEDFYIDYRIFKNGSHIIIYDRIAIVQAPVFTYKEAKELIQWKVLPNTDTIAGYACQQAQCSFGGRQWNAWFTMDIPISDGPYKFCGLPGLIVKVSDTQNYWNFTLNSFENKPYEYFDYEKTLTNKEVVATTKDKFLQLLKSSYDSGFEMEQQYGLEFRNKIEEEKQRYKDRARKENNWIEKLPVK